MPPELEGDGIEEGKSEGAYSIEASVIRNVGATRERVQVDQKPWGQQRFSDEEVATDAAASVVEENTVIENAEIDDAAEAFDLGDLFE